MTQEEEIQQSLVAKFGYLADKVKVPRARRISAEVTAEKFTEVFESLISGFGFIILCTITGLDDGETIGIMYHLARQDGILLNLKRSVPKTTPVVSTVMKYFPGSEIYERELVDMLGVVVEGLPAGPRYPLPDGWPAGQYPLRKDWKAEMLGEFGKKEVNKNG